MNWILVAVGIKELLSDIRVPNRIEFDWADAALSGVDRKINSSPSRLVGDYPSMGVLALAEQF